MVKFSLVSSVLYEGYALHVHFIVEMYRRRVLPYIDFVIIDAVPCVKWDVKQHTFSSQY